MAPTTLSIIISVFAIIVLIALIRVATKSRFPYVEQAIMTPAELRFFKTLRWCIPKDCYLSVKPRLGDIVDVEAKTKGRDRGWKGRFGAQIWAKHIDFVIFDVNTAEVYLCIELDDSSHNTREAKERDAFKNKVLAAADLPLVRIPVQGRYTKAGIEKQIKEYV